MKEITVDCTEICSRQQLHQALAESLSFPAHYGNNLDALHDCLTDLPQPLRLRLLNWMQAETALGSYGSNARRVMLAAAIENPCLAMEFE